jgi:hypothetical protein
MSFHAAIDPRPIHIFFLFAVGSCSVMHYVSNEVLDWVVAESEKAIGECKARGQPPPPNLVRLSTKLYIEGTAP